MIKKSKIALSIFAILFGIFMFVYGGYDDSPGAQAIGLAVVAIVVAGFIKKAKAKNKKKSHD
jgi:O-antigen/teichoic acid export membrane protein